MNPRKLEKKNKAKRSEPIKLEGTYSIGWNEKHISLLRSPCVRLNMQDAYPLALLW